MTIINGTSGNDTLSGGVANDTITGGAGNDFITGGDGNDRISGDNRTPAPVNVTNGDFTSNTTTGWTTTGSGTFAYDGFLAFNAANTAAGGTAQQTITTEGGVQYQLSFDAFETGSAVANHTLVVQAIDGNGQVIGSQTLVIANGTSQLVTLNFTATTATTTLRFSNPNSTGVVNTDLAIDNVTVTPLSTPVTTGNDTINGGEGSDLVDAGAGNDSVTVDGSFAGDDTLDGGSGIDTLVLTPADNRNLTVDMVAGTVADGLAGSQNFSNFENLTTGGGNDNVTGTADANVINTQAGNDFVQAGGGNDTVFGGAGDDDLRGGTGTDSLDGGIGNDSLFGGDDNDLLRGSDGSDTLSGGLGNDDLRGGNDNDVILGDEGDDFVEGNAGDDSISGGDGADNLRGNEGNDTIDGGAGNEFIDGGTGNDSILGGAGADDLRGGDGNDSLRGGTGADQVVGGAGNDTIIVTSAAEGAGDNIRGNDFGSVGDTTDTDVLDLRGAGPVTISQEADPNDPGATRGTVTFGDGSTLAFQGIETILSDPNGVVEGAETGEFMPVGYADTQGDVVTDGADTIFGNGGNDDIRAGGGNDSVDGGTGGDFVDAGAGDDTVFGGEGNDDLRGGDGNDSIDGGADNDFVDGGTGNDTILGGAGNDDLRGGTGSDTLRGGTGADQIVGGAGNDTIIVTSAAEGAGDNIRGNDFGSVGDTTDTDVLDLRGAGPVTLSQEADPNDPGAIRGTVTFGDGSTLAFQGIETILRDNNGVVDGTSGADNLGPGFTDADGDQIDGTDGNNDSIAAGAGNDTVNAGLGNDTVDGGIGNDSVAGGDGNGSLLGGDGADTLSGGTGNDTLSGGDGRDTFVLQNGGGTDRITDFNLTRISGIATDQVDASSVTDTEGNPVNWQDVVITDTVGDGSGDAVLTFPNGQTLILTGVAPGAITGKANLVAIGIPCFAAGTAIRTPSGWRAIETLQQGDIVATRDHGLQPILWCGMRRVERDEIAQDRKLLPVHIKAWALGNRRDLRVSAQHAVLMQLDGEEVFVRATHLARHGFKGVRVAQGVRSVQYHHLLMPKHTILDADGLAAESFYPGPNGLASLSGASRMEIAARICRGRNVIGETATETLAQIYGPTARRVLTGREARDAIEEGRLRGAGVAGMGLSRRFGGGARAAVAEG